MHYAITFFSGIFMDYLREYGFKIGINSLVYKTE